METTTVQTKGEYQGVCNLSRCTSGKPATWYNHGSLKFYCEECAKMLSDDPVNAVDAQRLFGHPLCTEGIPEKESVADEHVVPKVMTVAFVNHGTTTVIRNYNSVDRHLREKSKSANVPVVKQMDKVHRNQMCPCGSGKKYKKCCQS